MILLMIEFSGKAILTLMFISLFIIILWAYLKRDTASVVYDEAYPPDDIISENKNIVVFNIKNNTDEEIELDLCQLDEKDSRYSFNMEDKNYTRFIDYIKVNSLFICNTRVSYGYGIDFYKNFIYHNEYNPFKSNKKPILVAFDNFDSCQVQKNIIQSNNSYIFDYLNSLEIKLIPKDDMRIVLFCSDYNKLVKYTPLICALSIKNNTNEKQVVELFNKDYIKKINENKYVDIQSIFGEGHYSQIVEHYINMPLIATKLKFVTGQGDNNKYWLSLCKINNKEFKLGDYITVNQFQANVIDVDLIKQTCIFNMSFELEPNSEVLLSIK